MDNSSAGQILIIPGAGASRLLGRDGKPMPLMTDWATSLRTEMDQKEPGAAEVIGLRPSLPGAEFERNLGQFLAFQASLPLTAAMIRLGADRAVQQPHQFVTEWHTNATNRAQELVRIIHRNLFENFGMLRLDLDSAMSAYETLLGFIRDAMPSARFAFATTNYDPAIETAVDELGLDSDDGFVAIRRATPVLDPLGLAQRAWQKDGPVPVLHLHGAVGWYRTPEGRILRHGTDQGLNESLGTPALLLPDSSKTPESFVGAEQLWSEFRQLLDTCTHVLFVGHSLHDAHLVDMVRRANKPTAVTWYPADLDRTSQEYETALTQARDEAQAHVPNSYIIPAEFGPETDIKTTELDKWLQ